MKRKSISEQWDDFSLRVGLYNVSSIQRQEMRRAFYGGAASILAALVTELDDNREPTEADMEYISSLHREIGKYGEDLRAGNA